MTAAKSTKRWFRQAERCGSAAFDGEPGAADQGLGGDGAGVETIPAHAVGFHQRDPGAQSGAEVRANQTGRAGAEDHEVAVEARGRDQLLRPGITPEYAR